MNENDSKDWPIPVEVASSIGRDFRKSLVWIIAYDPFSNRMHLVTWAARAESKLFAAEKGEEIMEFLGLDPKAAPPYEDFRLLSEAKADERIDELKALVRELRAELANERKGS